MVISTYRKEDLVRVWREFPAGPAGVFLKRGRSIDGGARSRITHRYYYGKSFIYPLFAAPFIVAVRHQRVSRAPRGAAVAGAAVRLSVPARAVAARGRPRSSPPASSWRASCRCTSSGSCRRCSTSRWRAWRTSAGSIKRWRRRSGRRAGRGGCSRGRSDLVAGGPARDRDVLEADQRAAVRRAGALLVDVPPEGGSYDEVETVLPPSGGRSFAASLAFVLVAGGLFGDQHGDLRRLELPGRRRSQVVLLRVPVPERGADAPSSARRSRATTSMTRRHLQPAHVRART